VTQSQESKQLERYLYFREALASGRTDIVYNSLVGSAFTVFPTGGGEHTLRQFLEECGRMRTAFSNLASALKIEEAISQDNKLAVVYWATLIHDGTLIDADGTEFPPTGRSVTLRGSDFVVFQFGKIVQIHPFIDRKALHAQLM